MENNTLDPNALILTKAIGLQENGGKVNYNALGDGGSSAGQYQWNNGSTSLKQGQIPSNFATMASRHGLDGTDFSPENQNRVAYTYIKGLLDSGMTPAQVASSWNAGRGEPNAYTGKFSNGSASTTSTFDVPGYVKGVQGYAQKLWNEQQNNPTQSTEPTLPQDNAQPDNRSIFRKIGDLLTGNTQAAGKLIGESLAAPGNAQSYSEVLSNWTNQIGQLQDKIKQTVDSGQDPSRLQGVLKQALQNKPKLEDFTGDVINKTPEQVVGTLAGSGLEALSGGLLSGGAEALASKELGIGGKILQGAKIAAPYGAVGGVASAAQNNESAGNVIGQGLLGGASAAALGGVLGGAGAIGGKVISGIDNSGIVNKILPETDARVARMQTAVTDAQKNIAESYKKALPLTPTQQMKEANLLNKTGDNVYTTLAKYNINAGSEDAVKQLQQVSDHFANATEYAQKNEHGLFNLDEIKSNAENQINQNIPSETGRIAAKDKIDNEVEALVKANKDSVIKGPNNETLIDSKLVERLRKTGNSWTNFNLADPEKIGKSTGYALSNAVRDQVEKQGTFPGYREANKEWSKVIHAQEVLQKISDSGKTFKALGGLSGTIARRILSGVIGLHTGGIGGAILGEMGSEYGAKILSNPALRTYFDRQLIARFGAGQKATPEVVAKLIQEIEGHIKSQEGLLRLPAPSYTPMGAETKQPSFKTVPAKAISIQNPKTGKFERAYTSEPKNLQGGFIKGADSGSVLKVHSEDKGVMRDFIDYVAGDYKPSPKEARTLELEASRIAERYNIKQFTTTKGLSGEFARILKDQGFRSIGKIATNPLIGGAAILGAGVVGSKLLKKRR